MRKTTNEEFIIMSNDRHNNKFTYDDCVYISNKKPILIKCALHGNFSQKPSDHLSGRGCPECGGRLKLTKEQFITRADMLHDRAYLYDYVEYVNMHTHVKIICKLHGEFYQTPDNHLRGGIGNGNGCPFCNSKRKSNRDEFIVKANKTHDNIFDYNLVNYKNCSTKIEITCKKHGIFKQTPSNHLTGYGCPSCRLSKGALKIKSILKHNNIDFEMEYCFKDLRYKDMLYFDFAIFEDKKLKYLIEFNGKQHYIFMPKFFHKTVDEFEISKIRDNLKIDYCIVNNIPLLIIRYDEDVEEKIKYFFNNLIVG